MTIRVGVLAPRMIVVLSPLHVLTTVTVAHSFLSILHFVHRRIVRVTMTNVGINRATASLARSSARAHRVSVDSLTDPRFERARRNMPEKETQTQWHIHTHTHTHTFTQAAHPWACRRRLLFRSSAFCLRT